MDVQIVKPHLIGRHFYAAGEVATVPESKGRNMVAAGIARPAPEGNEQATAPAPKLETPEGKRPRK